MIVIYGMIYGDVLRCCARRHTPMTVSRRLSRPQNIVSVYRVLYMHFGRDTHRITRVSQQSAAVSFRVLKLNAHHAHHAAGREQEAIVNGADILESFNAKFRTANVEMPLQFTARQKINEQ